jgi:hypothetical protein
MKTRRACLHQRDRAWLGLNEQQIVGQENLALAIPAILPFAFARGEIKADKDTIVQTKGEAVACFFQISLTENLPSAPRVTRKSVVGF